MLENVPEAMADFSLAISLDISNHRAFYNRACACHRKGDLLGAIRDFTIALQLDHNHAEAYFNRGIIRQELGYQQAAMSDLKMASKCFDAQGNRAAYKRTLALIQRLKQLLQSSEVNAIA
jgi:tetratricopeptide (TPR) repeat protein